MQAEHKKLRTTQIFSFDVYEFQYMKSKVNLQSNKTNSNQILPMQNINSKRWSNNIASNVVRSLQTSIKTMFSMNPEQCTEIRKFISKYQIQGQLWGFYAIVIFLIFLKDQSKQLTDIEFNGLIFNFQGKLHTAQKNYQQQGAKDEYQKYIDQLNILRTINFGYLMESYETIMTNLLSQMIKKRHRMGEVYFDKLKDIIDDLKTEQVSNLRILNRNMIQNHEKVQNMSFDHNDNFYLRFDHFGDDKYGMMNETKQMRVNGQEIYIEID